MDHGATTSLHRTHWQSRRSKNLRKRKLKRRYILSVTPLLFLPLLFSFFPDRDGVIKNAEAHHIITEVLQVKPQTNKIPLLINPPDPTQEIENYIRTIFGPDADIAVAVAKAESGFNTTAQLKTAYENSIGIFQINIESDTAKVHWDRIPGRTLDEKIEWLKNPYNNTLLAYWIFTNDGWYPWSAFTNGKYLEYL